MTLFSGFETTFALFVRDLFGLNIKHTSYLFVYIGLLSLLIQGGIIRKAKGSIKLFSYLGLGLVGFGFLAISVSATLPALLASLALLCLGVAFTNSFLPALLSILIQSDIKGTVMGIFESNGSLGRIIGPIIGSILVLRDPRQAYLFFAFVLFMTIGSMLILSKSSPLPSSEEEP